MVKALKASSIAPTIVAALAGCAVGPNYKRPETPVAPQAKFGHLSTFVSQAARSASRIALTESSTSSSVVAQELTLIRMAARPLQVLPPHQHLPES